MRRENNVNIEEFDYDLPESLIAQTPLKDRDHSRLLVMDRETGEMKHYISKISLNILDLVIH